MNEPGPPAHIVHVTRQFGADALPPHVTTVRGTDLHHELSLAEASYNLVCFKLNLCMGELYTFHEMVPSQLMR